jgi:hypothetical protein
VDGLGLAAPRLPISSGEVPGRTATLKVLAKDQCWPDAVVVTSSTLDDDLRFAQRVEDLAVEELARVAEHACSPPHGWPAESLGVCHRREAGNLSTRGHVRG